MLMSTFEILEPYPNEILYSWLSRMFHWYGFKNNPRSNIREFNSLLFGINSRSINNILIPHNLQDLVISIHMYDSEYFATTEVIVDRFTIMPFYFAFISESEQKIIIDNLLHCGPINITKSILGLKDLNSSAVDYQLKFCFTCWTESGHMYFDLEHQIKDNYVCYKHNTRLQYILINSREYFFFNDQCKTRYFDSPFCLYPDNKLLPCYTEISSSVHDIFLKGFRDDIVKLKSKIRIKMISMGYMSDDFNLIENFDEFWSYYSDFNVLNIDRKELLNALYFTTKNPNPIIYLTLIIYLFGSLKDFYEYEIDEKNIEIINQKLTKVISLTQPLKPKGLIYYNDLIHKTYGDRYTLLGKIENKHYELKCNLCSHEWKIPQYYISSKLINCPKCKKNN